MTTALFYKVIPALIIGVLTFVMFVEYFVANDTSLQTTMCTTMADGLIEGAVSATSGKSFTLDHKIRNYNGITTINYNKINKYKKKRISTMTHNKNKCSSDHWIVLTTIFDVTPAIIDFNNISIWCTVVAGDKKSFNKSFYNRKLNTKKVIYLDINDQYKIFSEYFQIYNIIPFNHFGRKNLGYLYAIINGAKYIFDTDDDNVVIFPFKKDGIPIFNQNYKGNIRNKQMNDNRIRMNNINTFNIFTLYAGDHNKRIWPRGYDLTVLAESFNWHHSVQLIDIKYSNEYIIQQWLANIEPDFDAIGRLIDNNNQFDSSGNKYQFDSSIKSLFTVSINNNIYIPFNAQMTIWDYRSFLFIYLPITVHGRVSDIWRSYFAQTIMHLLYNSNCDINWKLLYCPVIVDQYRNAHKYIADFQSEIPLYLQTNALINFLQGFANNYNISNTYEIDIGQILLDLYIELYEYGIIEVQDIDGIRSWIEDIYSLDWKDKMKNLK